MLENVADVNKVVFKCKHCDNDDLRYMKFASLNKQSPQYQNHIYKPNWDYETTPKIPVGIHIKCAKCNKDTFIIPDSYNGTEWGNDIPDQCIIPVRYERPQFSAIQYVMNDEGYLDKIVVTANNERISLISEQVLRDDVQLSVIGKKQYELLLSRGLQEVKSSRIQTPSLTQPISTPQPVVQEEKVVDRRNNKGSDTK